MSQASPRRRREVLDALRRGTVPHQGLDLLAVGLDRFEGTIDAELETVRAGGAVFKAVRGEYGSGKTFFARWLGERAKQKGLAFAEVQISETETPLHRLETVYRRVCESLETLQFPPSAFRPVVDAWIFALEQEGDVATMIEKRLASVSQTTPAFAAALRGYAAAQGDDDVSTSEGLAAWLAGQPHVASGIRRSAGVRGDLDHFGALGFLQGLLTVLRDSGHPGLVLVLDEVETLQRVRTDVREKALNALRQLVDEVDGGRFPGLYLVITGTPAFFDGTQGMQRLPPLAQRIATDFTTDARFDNPRAVQIRLPGFTRPMLEEVGTSVRDLYASGSQSERLKSVVDDQYIGDLAAAVTGSLGGRAGVAPRLFLKKLVADVLDRVEQFDDFDPRVHYAPTVSGSEMTDVERNAASSVDDVEL
ncbi:BREX system ATP-binding protein BrxD [Demequina muriae]|uniref:BREX system ATP-binding protein BrxD n=1 Tax=Demequina muriae TaxID=3051664 RepID=A0ABT8GE67_9MICO|nr:BREX system ATP-binding protein BrxD [Demequina sp. EGI L300058]MDN4479714.1 BREX system ATP-binding protein BrxD [Demequina sp. EGI L300058]